METRQAESMMRTMDIAEIDLSDEVLRDVQDISVPIQTLFDECLNFISVNDFAMLQPGDIIKLDRNVDDELDVYVGNIKKFTAVPGASKDAYAVRVTNVIREEN